MTWTAPRVRALAAAAALTASLLMSGCAAGQISQTADEVAAIDGANGGVGQIAVRNVELVGTDSGGYAKGADASLKMMISNEGLSADTLADVSSPAASSVAIAGPAAVPAQSLVSVGGRSKVTVTLKGLTDAIPYGHSVPVTFSFKSSGPITVNVPIAVPDQRVGAPRSTIDIEPGEDAG